MNRLNASQDKTGESSYRDNNRHTLLVYLGNPIVKNDCIGIKIGNRLEKDLKTHADVEVHEFVGSPLDLVTQLKDHKRIIIIDSVITGSLDIGSVVVFKDDEFLSHFGKPHFIHGVNLPEALALSKCLGLPLPPQILLIGIEIGKADEFGDTLSDELNGKMDDIYHTIYDIISRFS